MNEKKMERVINPYGVEVKMCCASCRYRKVENDGTRVCRMLQLKVGQQFKCQRWKMNRSCQAANCRMGKVKRLEYLLFIAAVRNEENLMGIPDEECGPVEEIRQEFTERFGSIYGIH